MAPSVAIGAEGRPVVAWAASDGSDAEIWIVERGSSGWSSPRRITDNDVPDITPSIAADDGTLVVAWTSFSPSGYVPNARLRATADTWQPAHRLSPRPGAHPIALFAAGDAVVLWESAVGSRRVLRSSVHSQSAWGPVSNLATAAGARPAGAGGAGDRLAVAWRRPDGTLAAAEGEILGEDRGERVPVLRFSRFLSGPASPGPESTAVVLPQVDFGAVPHTFSAFGDSITLGIVVPSRDPLIIVNTPGYVGPLESMLEDVFGAMTFSNDGVGGETTSEGLNRIAGVIRARRPDSLLLMEGTNDVTFLVDPATIAFNLRQMISRANAEQPGIITFLGTLIPRNEGWDNELNQRTDTVNDLLVSVANDSGATLVDTHTALDGNGSLFSDHVHPNEAGYDVLAGSWYEGVEPVLMSLTNLGDIDGSGRVDGADLVLLGISFGSVAGDDAYSAAADINQDGLVDGFDLAILADHFGQVVAGSSS
jgi:lysophospholipase L1-like esterase